MIPLIGIAGKSGAGKDLTAKIIKGLSITTSDNVLPILRRLSYKDDAFVDSKYSIKKFSTPLKQMVCILLGCTMEDLEDHVYKKQYLGNEWGNITPRYVLEILGTDIARKIHPNVWVNSLFLEYDSFKELGIQKYQIITDVRFKNEVEAIKDRGGIIIRIERPDLKYQSNHYSQTALDNYTDWDYVIKNTSLEELIHKVEIMWRTVNG
jgi:hypothetical protein